MRVPDTDSVVDRLRFAGGWVSSCHTKSGAAFVETVGDA